jgi:hypothetical protein
MENPKYQDVNMSDELWQEISEAMNSYLSVKKLKEFWISAWFHPSVTVFLGDLHAGAVFDVHLTDTRVPLIKTFFRGVLTVLLLSTFMPAELDAALTQSKASYGCGIRALGCS